jgi:hypothetical protein
MESADCRHIQSGRATAVAACHATLWRCHAALEAASCQRQRCVPAGDRWLCSNSAALCGPCMYAGGCLVGAAGPRLAVVVAVVVVCVVSRGVSMTLKTTTTQDQTLIM